MTPPHDKLRAILGVQEWSRFLDVLRSFRDAGRALPAAVSIADPTEGERRRLSALLRISNASRAQRLRYDLRMLSEALARAGALSEWNEILDVFFGPVAASIVAAQAAVKQWEALWAKFENLLTEMPFPSSGEWLNALRREGVLKRLSSGQVQLAHALVESTITLLRALPLNEEQPLTEIAARFCGDSHALDPDRPLSTLVLRGLALRQEKSAPSKAADRRALWGAYGVVCDELSAPVLTYNLGLRGDAPIASLITEMSRYEQPVHLSTRLLWATPWARVAVPARVFVCENPTIVALASTRLKTRCAPLVCIDGEIKTAARVLLRSLRQGGARLFYHGDFDWPGLGIAQRVFREFDAYPWQFDAEAYRQLPERPSRALSGIAVPSPWSPDLTQVMQGAGRAYDEEVLADNLLKDLDALTPLDAANPTNR